MQDDRNQNNARKYEAPKVTVMSEAEVLKAFQITSAGLTWWSM